MPPGFITEVRQSLDEQGFCVVRDVLGAEVISPVRALISRHVEEVARDLRLRGEVSSTFSEEPFERRLAALYEGRTSGLRKWSRFLFSPALYGLVTHPPLLDILEEALGPELVFHGDQQLVPKIPGNAGQDYPWHQDTLYYGLRSRHLKIITVWVPLVDVDENNGTLLVMPGSHRWGVMDAVKGEDHFFRPTADIERLGTPIAMRMRTGDVLLMTNLTFHASGIHCRNTVRWTMDLGYSAVSDGTNLSADERESREYIFRTLEQMGRTPLVVRSSDRSRIDSWETWLQRRRQGRPHVGP